MIIVYLGGYYNNYSFVALYLESGIKKQMQFSSEKEALEYFNCK